MIFFFARSGAIEDSGGETNVLVEEVEDEPYCREAPFDWRKVEVSHTEKIRLTVNHEIHRSF